MSATKRRIYSRPLHYQWDLADPNAKGSCVNFHAFFIGKGIANVCLNAIIFVLVSTLSDFCTLTYTAKWKADPASLASPGHSQTADHFDIRLHTRRLVSHMIHVQWPSCSLRHSVIIVSIVWIIVVPDVTRPDITCKYYSFALLFR